MTLPAEQSPPEPTECAELLWMLADPDPPPFSHGPGPLLQWYQEHGLGP
jgi:hypothetical protein